MVSMFGDEVAHFCHVLTGKKQSLVWRSPLQKLTMITTYYNHSSHYDFFL